MKIGILTFHRANNCGAVLQCYALQETLRSLGHEVSVIDYRQPYIEKLYSLKNKIRRIIRHLKDPVRPVICRYKFNKFRENHITISEVSPTGGFEHFDAYVIGSDQVWSEQCTIEFDDVYYGYFKRNPTSKVIGYSVSCPLKSIDKLGASQLKKALQNFNNISFREKALRNYISQVSNFEGEATLDPVLLQDNSFWNSLCKSKKKRKVLVYLYKSRLTKSESDIILAKGKEIASNRQTKIYDMSDDIYGPEHFMTEIRNADFVITNSFHAIAFSLIFKKDFAAITSGDELDMRYADLLKSVGAEHSLMTSTTLKYVNALDYKRIEEKLKALRTHSIDFLKDSLSPQKHGESN